VENFRTMDIKNILNNETSSLEIDTAQSRDTSAMNQIEEFK